jgi:hypothetical protein
MCFGDTKTTTKSKSLPGWLDSAAQGNVKTIEGLQDTGYQTYGGPRVADMNSDENWGSSLIRSLAGSSNPYTAVQEGAYNNAATAGPQQVSTGRVIDDVRGSGAPGELSGSTADYMDPYIASVLAPQLRQIDEAAVKQGQSANREATMAGAFGDARMGFKDSEIERDRVNQRIDTTGRGYSQAFNTAMQLKNGDINRNLQADTTNGQFAEQGMARAMAGSQALGELDKYNTGRQADLAGLVQRQGSVQRAIEQAKLDAAYGEHTKSQQYPLELAKLLGSNINGIAGNLTTETSTEPDNSGYGMLASLGGTALKYAMAPATGGASMMMPSPNGPGTYSPMFF